MTPEERERKRVYMRAYRAKDPEKHRLIAKLQGRKWRHDNAKKYAIYSRQVGKKWRAANPHKVKEIRLRTLAKNPHTKLANRVRDRINRVLKGTRKSDKTFNLVGCTPQELKVWLEAKFKPGMSWENRSEWHVDHIKPCALFDLINPEQQKLCFHYTNLQPLWASENLSKGSRIDGELPLRYTSNVARN